MVALQKYQNKKIAIYGMGVTGCSAARILRRLGSQVLCWDDDIRVRKKIANHNFSFRKFWLEKECCLMNLCTILLDIKL